MIKDVTRMMSRIYAYTEWPGVLENKTNKTTQTAKMGPLCTSSSFGRQTMPSSAGPGIEGHTVDIPTWPDGCHVASCGYKISQTLHVCHICLHWGGFRGQCCGIHGSPKQVASGHSNSHGSGVHHAGRCEETLIILMPPMPPMERP